MAEEDEEEVAPRPPPPAGTSKYFFLVLLFLTIEAAGAFFLLDKAVPAPELPPTEDMDGDEEEEVWVAPRFFEGIEHLVFAPAGTRGRLVQMSFAIEVTSQAAVDELSKRQTVIWDMILRKLETFPDLAVRQADKTQIKEGIIGVVNGNLKNGEAIAVYLTEFVMQ